MTTLLTSLGEMAAGIAHEINNPLAIILGKASQIRRKLSASVDLPTVALDLQKIEQTIERISKIVRGLRTFSRSGEGDPLVPVSLAQLLDDALDLCSERMRNAGVELRIHPLPEAAPLCRPIQIGQVLVNLIQNAHDAIRGTESPWIEISGQVLPGRAEIWVTDSGLGIPESIRARVMEPFFTTKEIGKGTGLGLSISRGIMESHGGELRLDTACLNTRFVLWLPLPPSS